MWTPPFKLHLGQISVLPKYIWKISKNWVWFVESSHDILWMCVVLTKTHQPPTPPPWQCPIRMQICFSRHLPMIAAQLRGRVHLKSKEFTNQQHLLVFSHVLGLLDLLKPHIFRQEKVCATSRCKSLGQTKIETDRKLKKFRLLAFYIIPIYAQFLAGFTQNRVLFHKTSSPCEAYPSCKGLIKTKTGKGSYYLFF